MAVDGRLKVLFHGTGEASWCPGIAVITTAQSRIENNGAALRHRRECFRLDSGDFLMLSFSASAVHDLSSSRHCPFGGQGSQASTYQQNLRISWCSISPVSQPVKLAIYRRSHRNQG